jgi:hypothetical protein
MRFTATLAAALFLGTATAFPTAPTEPSEVAATFDVPVDFTFHDLNGKTLSFNSEQVEFLKNTIPLSIDMKDDGTTKISLEPHLPLQKRFPTNCALCVTDCVAWSVRGGTGAYAL